MSLDNTLNDCKLCVTNFLNQQHNIWSRFLGKKKHHPEELQFIFGIEWEFVLHTPKNKPISKKKLEEFCKYYDDIREQILHSHKIEFHALETEITNLQFELFSSPPNDINNLITAFSLLKKQLKAKATELDIVLNNSAVVTPNNHPRITNGIHVHFNITAQEQNLFAHKNTHSKLMLSIIQSILDATPSLLDSYIKDKSCLERYIIPDSDTNLYKHNPTKICWGINNRTTLIRVPIKYKFDPHTNRIEIRTASAAADLSKILEAILFSIITHLPNISTTSPATYGDAFRDSSLKSIINHN